MRLPHRAPPSDTPAPPVIFLPPFDDHSGSDPTNPILRRDMVGQAELTAGMNTDSTYDLQVTTYNNKLMQQELALVAPYCTFGSTGTDCNVYNFKSNAWLFPNGKPIIKTMYVLRTLVYQNGTAVGAVSRWVWVK